MDYQEYQQNKSGAMFGKQNMVIYEPCNYVSNVAYYHGATRICDYPGFYIGEDYIKAMKRAFTTHAMG